MENQPQNRTLSESEVQELNFSKDFLKIAFDFSEDLGKEPINVSKILDLVMSKRNDDDESITHKLLSNVIAFLEKEEKKQNNLLLNPKLEFYISLNCNCGIRSAVWCSCSEVQCTCVCVNC